MTPTSVTAKSAPRRVRNRGRQVGRFRQFVQATQRVIVSIGLRELHFYVGVVLAAIGGAQLSGPITLIALGAVLSLVGIRGIR